MESCRGLEPQTRTGSLRRYQGVMRHRPAGDRTFDNMEPIRSLISLLAYFVIPVIVVGFPLYGLYKRVPVYESFVEGAKEGFNVAVRIIPYLVAILFAIGMFRASGAMDFLVTSLNPLLILIGFPGEVLPMAIIRPLTGSGSAGLVADMINQQRKKTREGLKEVSAI